jgi:ankyrin repeat protein
MRKAIIAVMGLLLSVAVWAGPAQDEALIEAIKAGDLRLVQGTLEKGANVEAKGPSGASALGVATLWRRLDIAEELLKRGADLKATASGCTPLCLAILRGYPEFIALFMAKGATMGTPSGGSSVLGALLFGGMKQPDFDSMQAASKIVPVVAKDGAKPDFTGVWTLDRKRSTYTNSPKLPETTLKVWQLGKYLTSEWNGSVDGYIIDDDQPVNPDGTTATRTPVKWQESALVFAGSSVEKKTTIQTESTWRLEEGSKQLKITKETKGQKPGRAALTFMRTGDNTIK